MSSKKEEERNEKIIRGLMKLPPNRRCINCNSLGPQYVCTNFWTFVCIACSGIHREFTHRVKSVSMAKFTKDEVEALQNGGNQRAREIFLKDWDMQQMRLPDSSKPDKIREFIKNVYIERKYAGGRSSDKPPRDMQSLKSLDESRRASSYHSYSQSPPYDHQYEDRRYGKQSGFLTRKPGSDRVHYEGKISSFMYSPGSLREQMYEDKFANESSGPRMSDFSVSSTGDPFRSDGQSPNFQPSVYSSPPLQQARDALVDDALPSVLNRYPEPSVKGNAAGIQHPQRTASLGSVGSFDSNCTSLKSVNSGSLMDVVFEPDDANRTQQLETSSLTPSSKHCIPSQAPNLGLSNLPVMQPSMTSPNALIDFFAEINHQSAPTVSEQKPLEFPQGSGGWATFDIPQVAKPDSATDIGISPEVAPVSGGPKNIDTTHGDLEWFSAQISKPSAVLSLMEDRWHICPTEVKGPSDQESSHSWNAFGGSTGGDPHSLFDQLPDKSQFQISMQQASAYGALHRGLKVSEDSNTDGTQKATVNDRFLVPSLPFNGVPGQSGPPPGLPQMGVATEHQKSSNPFDFPYDTEVEPDNLFLDMSSLQAALPNTQLPPPFLGGLPQQLFPPNSVKTYIPHVPQEGLPYMGMQAPSSQLPNVPSQGPVASLGGNPFA